MKQLQAVIRTEGFDIVVNKSKTKSKVAKEILAAYAARDVDAARAGAAAGDVEPKRPVNPALEAPAVTGQTASDDLPANQPIEQVENRGGARPGAGRPLGMDAERARMTRLSECPHPAVLGLLNMLFDAWAAAAKCPEIALTKSEAHDLALPWTNVLEYAGVADKIPVWAELAIVCTWNTVNVFKVKLKLAQAASQERKRAKLTEGQADDATDRA